MNYIPTTSSLWYKIAIAQFKPQLGNKPANLDSICSYVKQAAMSKAKLIVFPEMANSGYIFNSRREVLKLAETPQGDTFEELSALAKKHSIYIVYGYPELSADLIYNSQNLIDCNGKLVCTYRKINLYRNDLNWSERGNRGYITQDTEFGKLGLGICMDMNFDNFTNFHIEGQVDIVAISSCWLEGFDSTLKYWLDRWEKFQGIIAIANINGIEQSYIFSGHSCLIEKNKIVAHAHNNSEGLIITEHQYA